MIVTVGGNEAVLITMLGLLNPGDEVLIPDPCWLNYFYCVQMAGAVPVSVPAKEEHQFVPQIDDFRSRLTPRTRMVVINTPNNPTGAVYTAEALEELARLAREKDLFVLSDEIYEKMVYDGARHISIGSFPGMKERTITVNGFSKNYSMTGWRLGYAAADPQVISALIRIHQYATICSTSFAQWGAVAALKGPQTEITHMMEEFDRRRNLVYDALRDMRGIHVLKPLGAFYIFPNIKETGKTSMEMTQYLIEKAKVAVVPGSVFGDFGGEFLRISYANSFKNLEMAMEKMKTALKDVDRTSRPAVFLSLSRDCVVMSLRGTPHLMRGTEAISKSAGKAEIAALSRQGGIARNDNVGIATRSPRGSATEGVMPFRFLLLYEIPEGRVSY